MVHLTITIVGSLLLSMFIAVLSDDSWVKSPSLCEVCKYLAIELKDRLDETGKSREVIETGHGFDNKKKIKYRTSELRLMEALHEPHICEKILTYNVHAEREGSLRYAKGQSETMQTLHGLVDKGVKVELGIPYEMWDKPSAEVSLMQRKCYQIVEEFEDDIDSWYYHHQEENIIEFLCKDKVLKDGDYECLNEVFVKKNSDEDGEVAKSKRSKKNKKSKKKQSLKGDVDVEDEIDEHKDVYETDSSSQPPVNKEEL